MPPFRLARRLEDPEIRRRLADQLRPQLGDATAVGLPAVLGRERAAEVHADLEHRLGRPVFEIPGLPPSLPGLRLFDCLRRALLDAGGRLLLGSTALSATHHHDTVGSVTITQASRPVEVSAGFYVLATGGFTTGGIIREPDGQLREPVFGLPVHGLAPGQEPFGDQYLAEHPLDRVGLSTDAQGRPLGTAGGPHAVNLYAAGAVLAGALPWREKSGEGLSLSTGWHAAEAIVGRRREDAA
jgi:glycerol-3-phosphate dehydrogenase subunit B